MNTTDNPGTDTHARDLELATMRAVAACPGASQRRLAQTLGISLGKTNFLLRALLDRGLVKCENFRRSDNKLGYLYLLTPSGARAKARLTRNYLRRKEFEFERLRAEIDMLRTETAEEPR